MLHNIQAPAAASLSLPVPAATLIHHPGLPSALKTPTDLAFYQTEG